jgi:hypothetical protein
MISGQAHLSIPNCCGSRPLKRRVGPPARSCLKGYDKRVLDTYEGGPELWLALPDSLDLVLGGSPS